MRYDMGTSGSLSFIAFCGMFKYTHTMAVVLFVSW